MLNIAICDDRQDQLDLIYASLNRYVSEHSEFRMMATAYRGAMAFIDAIEKIGAPDIALLDVCMPGFLGTDIARELRKRRAETEIVFLTVSDEFAVDAFALKAAHYLLKPYKQSEFNEAMDRAVSKLKILDPKRLAIRVEGGEIYLVELPKILYIESAAHDQVIHLSEGTLTESRRGLARLQEELDKLSPGQFVSPYKGYILNLAAVRSIEVDRITLLNGERLPLAKRNFRELRDKYLDYTFGEKKP